MLELSQQSYIIAAVVVGLILTSLGFFLGKTFITSNFFQKGLTLYQQRDFKGAEAAFRQVISQNSTNDMVHLLLGDALMQQDKLEEATQEFQEVIRRNPKNVDAHLRLGNALMQQEKREEAISTLTTAKDLLKKQRNPQKADQIEQLLQQISQ